MIEQARWLDMLPGMLEATRTRFPAELIALELKESLGGSAVAINWNENGVQKVRHWPSIVPTGILLGYLRSGTLMQDPFARWYRTSAQLQPQCATRLPIAWFRPATAGPWLEIVTDFTNAVDRLVIPLLFGPKRQVVFTIVRNDRQFTETDIELATTLQAVVRSLALQSSSLYQRPALAPLAGFDLTARETAVVTLLGEGLTAETIARRLGIASRTVHKHQENLYRKLGVTDRLSAVLLAKGHGRLSRPASSPFRDDQVDPR